MKANDFIKKFGWDYAKERMEYCKGARLVGMEVELKRLVESYELIEKYKVYGDSAKWFFVAHYCEKNKLSPFDSHNYDGASSIYEQAIADVESCNA